MRHGTRSTYNNHRCRCGPCTAANNAYARVLQARIRADARRRRELVQAGGGRYVTSAAVTHGTRKTYVGYGCRCDRCTAAAAAWRAAYWQRKSPP